jgi:hypothetical protein
VLSWKAPEWKKRRDAEILAAIRQGTSPDVVACPYRVLLGAVLGICESAAQRDHFALEHAESGGPARVRTLGNPTPGRTAMANEAQLRILQKGVDTLKIPLIVHTGPNTSAKSGCSCSD